MKIGPAGRVHSLQRSSIHALEVQMKQLLSAAVVVVAVASATTTATPAHADSRSWGAIKNSLPDHDNVVGGANLATLRGTSLYQSILPQLLAKEPDARKAIDLAKSTCAIDLHAAIRDVTFAVGDDERGIVILALDKSIDQPRVLDCATKLVAAAATPSPPPAASPADAKGNAKGGLKDPLKKPAPAGKSPPPAATRATPPAAPPKVVARTVGKVTEYSVDGDPARFYAAWLAPDVVAFATDADDRRLLEKMIGGKGARGALASYLAKASSNAAIWLASTKAQNIQAGVNMKGAFGTINAAKGNIAVDLNLVLANAKEAKDFVAQATALIAQMKSSIPPQFAKLVDGLKLTAAADAANVKLTAPEKDIASVLAMAMMNL